MEPAELGHHFLIEVQGTELRSTERDAISSLCPLGVVIRNANFPDSSDYPDCMARFAALLGEIQALCGRDKLIVAAYADSLCGFKRPLPFTDFACARSYASDPKRAANIIREEFFSAGVNFVIGPNANVSVPSIVGDSNLQEFSSSVDEVTRAACTFVAENHKGKMLNCAFDFPGGGSVSAKGRERKSCGLMLQELEHRDIRPFAALIDLCVDAIRMSEGLFDAIDADYPAFMSVTLCSELLRKKLGFKGVILTPEMHSGQLERFYSLPEVMRAAFVAGCDLFHVPDPDFAILLAQHLGDVKQIKAASAEAFEASVDRLNLLYEAAKESAINLIPKDKLDEHANFSRVLGKVV